MKKNLPMVLLFGLLFLSLWQLPQPVSAQTQIQRLTLAQILTGLKTTGTTAETGTLAKRNVYIAKRVKQLGVTFRLNEEMETQLREAGATPQLIETIRQNSPTSEHYLIMGDIYYDIADYGKAIENYTEAISMKPNFTVAYNNRGNAHINLGELDKAIEDYTNAITSDSKYAIAYNNRAVAFYNKRKYDDALADYNKAIELDSKYAVAYNGRGTVYLVKGNYDKAIADYRKALELKPDFKAAKENLETALANKP
jgi:tetratricopeptide (TPR) repeat protein